MSTIMDQARAYLEKLKGLADDASRDEYKALREGVPMPVLRAAKRLRIEGHFVPERALVDTRVEHVSPSGAYKLVVTSFDTRGGWRYSQGLVYRGAELVTEVQRNYTQFPFAWLEGHAAGDFLVCGEDYQGQTVVNLKTGARRDHLPDSAEDGHGFCWAAIHPSPNGSLLAVEGCYWACPYEIRFYDFSDPMLLPWPEIGDARELSDFFEWLDDDRARIGGEENYYEPRNQTNEQLEEAVTKGEITDEERERFIADEGNWKERKTEGRIWVKPRPLQSLTTYAKDCLQWRKERDLAVPTMFLQNVRALLERLSDAERREFESGEVKPIVEWAFAHKQEAA